MAASFKEVKVSFNGGKPLCSPEWVSCFWARPGEENIRWSFFDFPEDVKSAAVEFMSFVPGKYREGQSPNTMSGFLPKPPFRGVGTEKPESGLPPLFTYGNRQEQGYFCYTIRFFDKEGKELYCCDPGGTNDPDPPETPHP